MMQTTKDEKSWNQDLDSNKIAFITCVNDDAKYEEQLKYLSSLTLPKGMKVESHAVHDAPSMAAGYNRAMRASDAKYKIYLHQDVWIIEPSFLLRLMNIFRSNSQVGIAGVVGSLNVPSSGVWWEGEMIGGVIDSHTGILRANIHQQEACMLRPVHVMLLDGLILSTQYDITWREDIFDKWHFYDASQCIEFYRRKLAAVVLPQSCPWCVHWCGRNPMTGYEEERQKFVKEYLQS